MRTLFEIIDAVKSGERPESEELRWAVLALDGLSTFDHGALRKLATAEREGKKPILTSSAVWQHEEQFNRWKRALQADPQVWCGPDFDPDEPAYQQRRRMALRLLDKVIAKQGSVE